MAILCGQCNYLKKYHGENFEEKQHCSSCERLKTMNIFTFGQQIKVSFHPMDKSEGSVFNAHPCTFIKMTKGGMVYFHLSTDPKKIGTIEPRRVRSWSDDDPKQSPQK